MELGRPLPVWHSAVAYGQTQVLNSNSTSAVQDPHPFNLDDIFKLIRNIKNRYQVNTESVASLNDGEQGVLDLLRLGCGH